MVRRKTQIEENVAAVGRPIRATLARQDIDSDETGQLAELIRAVAERDGGGLPIARSIRGKYWISFQRVVLDEIAADPWYDTVPLDEPVKILFSGAIRTVRRREDEALVKLARCVQPFARVLEPDSASKAA